MKKTSTIVAMFAAIVSLSLVPCRAEGQTVLDAHAVSRAMLDAEPTYYLGVAGFTGTNGQYIQEQFRLDFFQPDESHGYWAVTSLIVGTNAISINPTNPPIGLPVYASSDPLNYYASIDGFDANNNYIRFGYFSTEVLLPTDVIAFTNLPVSQQIVVYYQVPSGVNAQDLEIDLGGDIGYYNAASGGFVVSIDPVNRPHSFTIYNTVTGQPVMNGFINYSGGSNPSDTYASVNAISMVDQGGVLEVVANNAQNAGQYSYRELDSLNFDCSLIGTNGVVTQAKVINVSGMLSHDSFSVEANLLAPGSTIEVSTLINGELSLISSVAAGSDGSGQVTVVGYDRYSVTIKGALNSSVGNIPGFNMNVSSFPESWGVLPGAVSGSGDVGGKG